MFRKIKPKDRSILKAVVCCLYRYRTISVKVDAVISWSVKLYRSWVGLPVALLYEWTANVVNTILWCLGPLATRLVQHDFPREFWVVTRYFSALGWVLIQVLLVSSSVVSAWPLVSRAGHDGVLGCPFC